MSDQQAKAPARPHRRRSKEQMEAERDGMARAFGRVIADWPFSDRELSGRTIEALLAYGVDYPERLLFLDEAVIRRIPGIGKASLGEIMRYRARFTPGEPP